MIALSLSSEGRRFPSALSSPCLVVGRHGTPRKAADRLGTNGSLISASGNLRDGGEGQMGSHEWMYSAKDSAEITVILYFALGA